MEIGYSVELFENVYNQFSYNYLEVNRCRVYSESKYFKEAVLHFIFNLCERNPTDKVAGVVHGVLKSFLFKEPDQRRGVYKPVRYKILPVLWKNHRAIEKKKQKNYCSLLTN